MADKEPLVRRSAGMRARPTNDRPVADKPASQPSAQMQQITQMREAFREFMKAQRLAPTVWAKKAGVPPASLLAYLTGTCRELDSAICEKLARAAGVASEVMFAPKEKAASRPPFQSRIDLD